MSENKISATEYITNEELLEVSYVPYIAKKEIVDTILSQVIKSGDMNTIDTALLERVSCEIFIESITNINMSISSEDGLSGYDVLCMNNMLDSLISEIEEEYFRFHEILEYKVSDFIRNNNSTAATLLSIINRFVNWGKEKSKELTKQIENIDVKNVSESLKNLIEDNLNKYRDK